MQFKCESEEDGLVWVVKCRSAIERAWLQSMKQPATGPGRVIVKPISAEDFKMHISISVKMDGPTKVLKFSPCTAGRGRNRAQGMAVAAAKNTTTNEQESGTVDEGDESKDSDEDAEEIGSEAQGEGVVGKSMRSSGPHVDVGGGGGGGTSVPAISSGEEVSYSFDVTCDSISLSVVDSKPEEVIYLSLQSLSVLALSSKEK